MKIIVLLFISILAKLSNADLYNSSDPLTILTDKNFQDEVFNHDKAWVIEFYLQWCGHCIKFASIWRDFAVNIADWDHTIKVGAIDCADAENLVICKHYKVTSYPHIRLFSSKVNADTSGEPALSRKAEDLTMEIIEFLVGHQRKGTGSDVWAKLLPFKGTLAELTPMEADSTVVIIANQDMNEGTLTVMDLGNYPQVYVRTMNPSFARSIGLKFTSVPVLVTLDKNGNQEILEPSEETRHGFTEAIFQRFNIEKRDLSVESDAPESNYFTPEVQLITNSTMDVVYLVDMENAISYALRKEVFLHDRIDGEALLALKNFIHVLVKYFPGNQPTHNFLSKLYSFIVKHRDALLGEDFENAITKLETKESHLPVQQEWVGCKGSQPHLRGYPCGLWTLFHTLTVNAVLKDGNSSSYFPQEVLEAIHGYVKYFFGCTECSKHFQAMYNVDAKRTVQAPNDEILWLWNAHNKVNLRLKGDHSEDPRFPKRLFPSKTTCPQCFDWKDSYVDDEVIRYLKTIYGPKQVSTLYSESFLNSSHPLLFSAWLILMTLFVRFI